MKQAKIVFDRIVEIRMDMGAGSKGANLGPEALIHSFKENRDISLDNIKSIIIENGYSNDSNMETDPFAKNIGGILQNYQSISTQINDLITENKKLLVFSGDHSSAGGIIAGIKMAHPEQRLGIIWIDAHADLHTPFTTPSGNIHGMPLAISLGIDNKGKSPNALNDHTLQLWEKLKNTGGISPKIRFQDLAFIGIRELESQEVQLIDNNGIKNFNVEEFRSNGQNASLLSINEHLKDCDRIFVSFDVDSLDTSVSRGTGTPVDNGFLPEEITGILKYFMRNPKLCCLEITEINPVLDKERPMAEAARKILSEALN